MYIQEILEHSNESGFVCIDKETIVVNCRRVNGIPRLFTENRFVGMGEELNVVERKKIDSWKEAIKDYKIVAMDVDDMDSLDSVADSDAEVVELENGVIIIAPSNWN